jgi:hypothetical protein
MELIPKEAILRTADRGFVILILCSVHSRYYLQLILCGILEKNEVCRNLLRKEVVY